MAVPVLLMFHPGGFVFGSPAWDRQSGAVATAERRGFEVRTVNYPLKQLPGAVEKASQVARRLDARGRTVYAYGESSGGTLAALLADKGLVEASATMNPISNLRQFGRPIKGYSGLVKASPAQLKHYSPRFRRSKVPILAESGIGDAFLTPSTTAWAKHDPRVRLRTVPGGHLGAPTPNDPTDHYTQNMKTAMRYLSHREKLR